MCSIRRRCVASRYSTRLCIHQWIRKYVFISLCTRWRRSTFISRVSQQKISVEMISCNGSIRRSRRLSQKLKIYLPVMDTVWTSSAIYCPFSLYRCCILSIHGDDVSRFVDVTRTRVAAHHSSNDSRVGSIGVRSKRVKWGAKLEHESINNFKVLQEYFKANSVEKVH